MAAKRKGAPKMKADPLAAVTAKRLAVAKASRKPTVKGTFAQGTKSATSSNRGGLSSSVGNNQRGKGKSGGRQRRDRKGRFA